MTYTDLVDELAGLSPERAAGLRGHRPDVVAAIRASYDALLPESLHEDPVPGLDLPTRLLAAARAAWLERSDPVVAHYTGRLAACGPELVPLASEGADGAAGLTATRRLRAVLRHVELLVTRPAASTASDLHALTAAGLDDADIVVLSQVTAFVSFQVRVVHGLSVLDQVVPR